MKNHYPKIITLTALVIVLTASYSFFKKQSLNTVIEPVPTIKKIEESKKKK